MLGLWNLPMLAFIVSSIIVAYVTAWVWIAPPPVAPLGDLVSVTMPLVLLVMGFYLMGTCRIVGDTKGSIEVFGPLLVHRIPTSAIARVDASGGLRITSRSGRTVGSVAHGQSLLGSWAHYPRSAKAAAGIARFIDRYPGGAAEHGADIETRVRVAGLVTALALGALLLIITVLINRL